MTKDEFNKYSKQYESEITNYIQKYRDINKKSKMSDVSIAKMYINIYVLKNKNDRIDI